MPAVLQLYLLRASAKSALVSLVVLMSVLAALFFAELLGEVARGDIAAGILVQLLLLRLPEALVLVGPLALLTGLLLALGQLGQDHELTVMRASGLASIRVLTALLVLAAVWAGGMLAVTGWIGPWAAERSHELIEQTGEESLLAGIRVGQFERMEQGALSIYVGERGVEPASVRRVFIHHHAADGPEIITAVRGRVWLDPETGARFLTLFDGHQVRHGAGAEFFPMQQIEFARNDLRLPVGRAESRVPEIARQSLRELAGAGTAQAHREWHWRLAPAVASLLLAFLAAPMALRNPRAGRFTSVLGALLIYLVYSNAVHLGLVWIERGGPAAGPGLWPLHGLVLALGAGVWWSVRRRW